MSTQPKTIVQTLADLGLSENEALLYDTLLNTTDAHIPYLRQKTPFSRTLIYYLLKNLDSYGLLETKEIGKKTVYNAAPPEKLHDMIKEREGQFHQQKKVLTDIMSTLTSSYRLSHNKPGVRFFEGLEGNREVIFDSLKATGTIYTFADAEAVEKYTKDLNSDYVKKRIEKKIPKKIIALDTQFAREHYRHSASSLTEVRLMPPGAVPFQVGTQMYNDTVSFATLTDQYMIGVIVEDKYIAALHRSLFEYIWNSLPAFPAPPKPPAARITDAVA